MSITITDELRELAKDHTYIYDRIMLIADHIDEEHEKALRELNDYTSASILLPKDADGECIHPKDMLTDGKKVYTVTNITFNQCGFIVYGYGDNSRNEWPIYEVSKLHHHHETTVEDELTDLCERVWESALLGGTWSDSPVESYITEYAAKLQLKETE